MPTGTVTWAGLQTVHPSRVKPNRQTVMVNFELTETGMLRTIREPETQGSMPGIPTNHLVLDVEGTTYAATVNVTDGVKVIDVSDFSVTAIGDGANDGWFDAFGGDLYYVDADNIYRWNSTEGKMQLGLPALTDIGSPNLAFEEYGPNWPDVGGIDAGHKHGCCVFTFAVFDSKRRIYGPRTDVDVSEDVGITHYFVSPERFPYDASQWYKARLTTPPLPSGDHSGDKIAVFVSFSGFALPPRLWEPTGFGPDGYASYRPATVTLTPALGKRRGGAMATVSDLPLLEAIDEPETLVTLKRGQQELVRNGYATDAYGAPVASEKFTILPEGVALYFNPGGDQGVVEWSVNHPEQIARIDDVGRVPRGGESKGAIYGLKGDPIAFMDTNNRKYAFTQIGVYVLGYSNGQPVAGEAIAGWGAVNRTGIAKSVAGIHYVSHAGHILIAGGNIQRLERLGYEAAFESMVLNDKLDDAVCGSHDATSKLFLFTNDAYNGNQETLLLDMSSGFIGTVNFGEVEYLIDTGAETLIWITGGTVKKYPGSSATYLNGSATTWINDHAEHLKRMKFLALDVGDMGAGTSITVTITAYDHPDQAALETRNQTIDADDKQQRHILNALAAGLTGRYISINVATSGDKLVEVGNLEYEFEWIADQQAGR